MWPLPNDFGSLFIVPFCSSVIQSEYFCIVAYSEVDSGAEQ